MARRALQTAAVQQGAPTGKKLWQQIADLDDRRIITPAQRKIADAARWVGNHGADDTEPDVSSGAVVITEVTEEDAKDSPHRRQFNSIYSDSPLGRMSIAFRKDWLRSRGSEAGPLLFPVDRLGRIIRRRMTDQAIFDLLRRLAAKAGIARLTPHDGRRSYISTLLDLGADLAVVQKLAGHASPAQTSCYDRRSERARRRAVELLHLPFEG